VVEAVQGASTCEASSLFNRPRTPNRIPLPRSNSIQRASLPERFRENAIQTYDLHYHRITPSPFPFDAGLSMLPSSAPFPLCPRFRPVMPGRWKPWCAGAVGSIPVAGLSEAVSPNRDRKLLFLGFVSSLRPTSSNPSSSVALGF
jgi:hypothetical protein